MSGWYADPAGRYELRFHNGQVWTADVSTGGQRFVDRLPIEPPRRGGNGLAVASMVCGITGLTIGWVPFLGLAGIPTSIVAIVLGIVALRRARLGAPRRGFAITGVITGGLGLVAAAIGVWLSVLVVQIIDEYNDPGPVDTELAPCVADDSGLVTIDGTLRNIGNDEQTYSVLIEVSGLRTDRRERVTVAGVEPGESVPFTTTSRVDRDDEPSCRIVSVDGPLPFGLDPEITD